MGGFLSGRRRGSSAPSLPRFHADAPVQAVKLGSLGLRDPYDLSTIHFVGIRRSFDAPHDCNGSGLCYPARGLAVCDVGARHEAPGERCTCGFYAMRVGSATAAHLEPGGNQWLLAVELAGKVVVHEHGYRAQFQEVLRVAPPMRCGCRRGTPTVAVVTGRDVVAMCAPCAGDAVRRGALPVKPSELESALGVALERRNLAVHWLELVESGLLSPPPERGASALVVERPVRFRLRHEDGTVSELRTDHAEVLGRWLLREASSGPATLDLEVTAS